MRAGLHGQLCLLCDLCAHPAAGRPGDAALPEARAYLRESLAGAREQADTVGADPDIATALEARASLVASQGAAHYALRLQGAAAALRERVKWPLSPFDETMLASLLAPTRQVLSGEEQNAAWAEGYALTLDQAIASALDEAELA